MSMISLGEQTVREIIDRTEITDAIYRYATGQ